VIAPVVDIADVSKGYGGLRPLRIQRLTVSAGDHVALIGLDQPMAEVFVSLVTGAALPDRGLVTIFGQSTAAIVDGADWLSVVDRFGIITERAVLLDGLTVLQNLAVPFTLDIDPLHDEIASRAASLADEVGLPAAGWDKPVAALDPASRVRVRLARALALDPAVMLLDHATAFVDRDQIAPLGQSIRRVAASRGAAIVAVTADPAFASAVADRVLTLDAASGRLAPRRGSRWFGRPGLTGFLLGCDV
jgi:ABC-type transporter Mla maintaining outer membrane lipid asymmetry ATPase subunit MlaF